MKTSLIFTYSFLYKTAFQCLSKENNEVFDVLLACMHFNISFPALIQKIPLK